MSFRKINGRNLFYETRGSSTETLIFVHGSWVDHHTWDLLVPYFSDDFRVVTYDRRGHGQSERTEAQGKTEEDVSDLRQLIESFGARPVHVIANSFGASIVLKLAASQPDLFKSLSVHEPPLVSLADPSAVSEVMPHMMAVLEKIKMGETREAAILFVERIALGPGTWKRLPLELQETFVFNAITFLDEQNDPDWMMIDLAGLSRFPRPVLITKGGQSPAFFDRIVQTLAATLSDATLRTIPDAGHIPQVTHPEQYATLLREFLISN